MKMANPKWLKKDIIRSLRDLVKLEYNMKFFNSDMQKLSAGMLYVICYVL